MIQKLSLSIILLLPVILAQDLKPDVSFTENNDRFDLTNLWSDKKLFPDIGTAEDDESAESADDYRRRMPYDDGEEEQPTDLLKKKDPSNMFLTRKADGGFAYDDRMDSREGGTMSDFEENLKHFQNDIKVNRRLNDYIDYTQNFRKYRKSLADNADAGVLLSHAVPILLQVDGYLKPPLDKE